MSAWPPLCPPAASPRRQSEQRTRAFFSPLRPLLLGWAASLLGWGMVGLAMAAHGVTVRGDAWAMHLEPSLRDWLPWALLTPLVFRLVARLPLERRRWHVAVPVHLVCCALAIFAGQAWKDRFRLRAAGFSSEVSRTFHERTGAGVTRPGERPHGARERRGPGGPPPGFFEGDRPMPPDDGPPGFGKGDRPPPPPDGFGGGDRAFTRSPMGPPGERGFDLLRFFSFQLPIYLMLLTGAHAALFFRREQERAASLARARLDALRMQLQPHFLFNTLNTIAGLVHDEPDKADALLTALSELLRMSLETSEAQELPLQREVEFLERYLALMHARFEERLRYEIDAPPETRAALVPPMLLQPLVENAIEHGLGPKPGGGRIIVRAWRDGDMLRLAVRDDGAGLSHGAPPREGIGLGNTRARLRELHGDQASLSLRDDGDGLTAEIALLFKTSPEPT